MVGFLEKNLMERIEYLKSGRESKQNDINKLKQDLINYERELTKLDEAVAEFETALEFYKQNGGIPNDKQDKGEESQGGCVEHVNGGPEETRPPDEGIRRKESTK